MWMLGYNDGVDINMADAHSLGSRKLRPIMPRPLSAANPQNPPCLSRIHETDFTALNHHHIVMAEQSKREFNTQSQVVVSTRWNPTPEQLQTLEELYRRGTRTPSADQIQLITAQLRRFGKIEGKNVFYWFQNHKARERQKRRRQNNTPSDDEHRQPNCNTEKIGQKDPGSSMAGVEVEQNKNWATSTYSYIRTLPERTVAIQLAASKAAERTGLDCRAAEDEWLRFGHGADHNYQQQKSTKTLVIMEMNDTFQNITNSTITTTAPCPSPTARIIDPKPHQDYAIFFDSRLRTRKDDIQENGEVCFQECPTLQLFPLKSDNGGHGNELQAKETQPFGPDEPMETPYKFFEFLPLRN